MIAPGPTTQALRAARHASRRAAARPAPVRPVPALSTSQAGGSPAGTAVSARVPGLSQAQCLSLSD